MKIIEAQTLPQVTKPEGIDVRYYLFHDYEVHFNTQQPHTTQAWHHHEKIWETIYVIDGELTAHWRSDGTEKSQVVKAGDLVETERTPHTFSNDSDRVTSFLVLKRVPSDEDLRETFKTDKILD